MKTRSAFRSSWPANTPTYLLDTSVIIDALNGKRGRGQLFKELLQQGHLLACRSINVTEVYAGLRSHQEARTRELLESLQHFPISWPVVRLAGLLKRDKVSLDIFWLKDESLEDSANLPDPDVIATEIAEDLEAALDQFAQIASDLKP